MADYKVIVGSSAEQDLLSIVGYISVALREPAAAERIYKAIKDRILSLRQMPDRHTLVRDEFFARQSVRKLFAENYTVFYSIDEKAKTVRIIRILYNRREWQHLLGD